MSYFSLLFLYFQETISVASTDSNSSGQSLSSTLSEISLNFNYDKPSLLPSRPSDKADGSSKMRILPPSPSSRNQTKGSGSGDDDHYNLFWCTATMAAENTFRTFRRFHLCYFKYTFRWHDHVITIFRLVLPFFYCPFRFALPRRALCRGEPFAEGRPLPRIGLCRGEAFAEDCPLPKQHATCSGHQYYSSSLWESVHIQSLEKVFTFIASEKVFTFSYCHCLWVFSISTSSSLSVYSCRCCG